MLLSLRIRPFFPAEGIFLLVAGFFLCRCLCLLSNFSTPVLPFDSANLARFFANLRSRRAESTALTALRSSFEREASLVPSSGSPFGTVVGVFFDLNETLVIVVFAFKCGVLLFDVLTIGVDFGVAPGTPLHLCNRSFRFANLTLPGSKARISSTQSRS